MKKKSLNDIPVIAGRRRTIGRREVLALINEMEGHFDAQALYDRLKAKGSKVSRASVYRTIPILIESGIIAEVEKTEKHAHYEKVAERKHHDHLICLGCHKTIEFCSPTLEMLQDEICQHEAFKSVRHTLEIMGYCKKCSRK